LVKSDIRSGKASSLVPNDFFNHFPPLLTGSPPQIPQL